MNVVVYVALAGLASAGVLTVARVVRPGSLADRLVGLDSLALVVVAGVATQAVETGEGVFLDLLVVGALLGFLAVVFVARFIEERGQ